MLRPIAALLLAAAAAAAAAANVETLAERSQARAREVLDRAVEANGGAEALRAIKAVRLTLSGRTFPRLQMTTPAPPFEGGTFTETLLVDLENERLKLEQAFGGFGFEGSNTIVIADGGGTIYDHRARVATPVPPEQTTQQQFVQFHRRLPSLLLRQALNNTNSLRYLGEDDFEGRRQEVITFVMPDTQQVALYVDAATGLVSKYELLFVDALEGEEASEIVFGDYRKAGAYQLPRAWQQRILGEPNADYRAEAEVNPAIDDASFRVDFPDYARAKPAPTDLPAQVEEIAAGVFLVRNVASPNYNSLAVEFPDHVVLVEAPFSSAGADAVLERVKEAIPGKPVRYVVLTHHHGDHIGGVRSLVAEGATVVTTAANRPLIEAMAAAPQNDRLAKSPRKPEFLLVEGGRRVLEQGGRRLEVIDVGPNPHAKEMLVAWLPAQGIVFQADLFAVPNNDAPLGPPQPSTASFADKLEALGLPVKHVASVHGRPATVAEFRQALGRR